MTERQLLTIDEAADRISVSKQRAYELARRNAIPVVRLGRQVRIDAEMLEAWIRNGGTRSTGVLNETAGLGQREKEKDVK